MFPTFRAEDDDRVRFLFVFRKKASALCFLHHFSSWRRWSCRFSFFFLGKKLQLYVFDFIFRADDDDRVSFLFLFRKKVSVLCFLHHFSELWFSLRVIRMKNFSRWILPGIENLGLINNFMNENLHARDFWGPQIFWFFFTKGTTLLQQHVVFNASKWFWTKNQT